MPGRCGRCGGYVGAAEEKLALGKSWHLECFTCALCNKGLDSTNLAEYKELNDIYCISCYRQFIGPQGYGYGPNGPTLIVFDLPEGYVKDINSTKVVPQGDNEASKNWQHPPTRLGNRFMRTGINVPHYGHARSGSKPRNFKQGQRDGLVVSETTSARSFGNLANSSNNGYPGSDPGRDLGNRPPEMSTASSKGPPPPPPLPKSKSGPNSKSSPKSKSPAQISSRQFNFPQPPPPPQTVASSAASSNRQFNFKQAPPPPSSQMRQGPPPPPPLPPAPKLASAVQSVDAKAKSKPTIAKAPKSSPGSGEIQASPSQSNTSGSTDCPQGFYCGGKCVGTPSMPRYLPNAPDTRRNPLGPNFGAVRNVPKGIGEKCRRCGRPVYQAELQLGYYGAYHTECFKCCACGKKLDSTTVSENQGELFCKGCYRRNFAIHGCGFGQGAGALQTP